MQNMIMILVNQIKKNIQYKPPSLTSVRPRPTTCAPRPPSRRTPRRTAASTDPCPPPLPHASPLEDVTGAR
jgi:hypothetical protein